MSSVKMKDNKRRGALWSVLAVILFWLYLFGVVVTQGKLLALTMIIVITVIISVAIYNLFK